MAKVKDAGREDVNNDASPSHPTTSTTDENIEAMKKIILNNCLGKMLGLEKVHDVEQTQRLSFNSLLRRIIKYVRSTRLFYFDCRLE